MPAFALAFAKISALLFAAAWGPPIVGKLLTAVGGAVRANASIVPGTPPINPAGNAGIGPISTFLQQPRQYSRENVERLIRDMLIVLTTDIALGVRKTIKRQ
jgi:hypothetical protein